MKILFMPVNKYCNVEPGVTLLSVIHREGLPIQASCGGHGTCGKCKVLVTKGNDREYTKEEIEYLSVRERNKGVRLACAMRITSDTCVILNDEVEQMETVSEPLQATMSKELGLALDVGTTTVEYAVLDMEDGSVVLKDRFYNPQRVYGADVIARISYCAEDDSKVKQLQGILMKALEESLHNKFGEIGLAVKHISKVVVVANTTMCHLFTGRNPRLLAKAPFQANYMGGSIESAKELGLALKEGAEVEVLPAIGSHVGADTLGCLVALDFEKKMGNHLLIDIGTNGEIVFKGNNNLLACSTAAGPAFEGASLHYGMCAGIGAINRAELLGDTISYQTIGGGEPRGISATGIVDVVAALRKADIIDKIGYVKEEFCEIDPATGEKGYCLYRKGQGGIYISQKDIRQLQLAKAAIYAGISTMLNLAGIRPQELNGIWLTGAFGTALNLVNAMQIGLLPVIEIINCHQCGNAALSGAIMRVLSKVSKESLDNLAKQVKHVELSETEEFKETFIEKIEF